MGTKPPPVPVKSIDFRGFYRSQQVMSPHPLERKKLSPPGQIPEYDPEYGIYTNY